MMRRILPRAMVCTVSTMDPIDPDEPAAEGKSLVISCFGFVIEITIARIEHG